MDWINLEDATQLSEIKAQNRTSIIFKHSTRCSVSRMVLRNFEEDANLLKDFNVYYLDLLNFRDLSNQLATDFNIQHQSPQILVVKGEQCIYNASHEMIDAAVISEYYQ